VPTYYVSKAARELVTVALSGDGGDELWAGYRRHRVEQREQQARAVLGPASAAAGAIGRALPLSVKGARALRHLGADPGHAYALKHAYGMFEPDAKARLYSTDFAAAVRQADPFARFRDIYARCRSNDAIDRGLYVDVHTYMVDDILTKVDRMSMAVSLEARDPLLDHRLLEFAATVPVSLKIKDGRGKYLLRRVLQRRLPAEILDRGKHGFEAPIGEWLRGPLVPMADALLGDGRLRDRGIFDDREVARLWTEHREKRADHRHRLWQLIMLELWFRRFVDQAPAARAPYAEAI
jgi:asparagine synthase (glutamine-hydrolysing)